MIPAAVPAQELTIAALGDSLTQGYGLPADQGFVPRLQAWLDARDAGARLVNAGVSGDTTAGGLARVGWTLTDDVDAMIVALGGNDFLRGFDPATSRDNLAGILSAAAEAGVEVLLIGIAAPSNFGPDYKADFDAIFPALASEYDVPLHPDFLQGLAAAGDLDTIRRSYLQLDGLHPNAGGVELIVEDIGPSVLALIDRTRGG